MLREISFCRTILETSFSVFCLGEWNLTEFLSTPRNPSVQQLPWISTRLFQGSDGKDVAIEVEGNPIQDILLNDFTSHLIATLQWSGLSMHYRFRAENDFRSFEFLDSRAAFAGVAMLRFDSIASTVLQYLTLIVHNFYFTILH